MIIRWELLIRAIAMIETGYDPAASGHALSKAEGRVEGDGGRAVGPLQIHQSVVDDVNEWTGWHFELSTTTNESYASVVCQVYLQHWAKKLGHEPSIEDLARIWNGGPWGPLKPHTADYGRRVAAIYEDLVKDSKLDQLYAAAAAKS